MQKFTLCGRWSFFIFIFFQGIFTRIVYFSGPLNFFVQNDATDALQKMTTVLKTESTAGESFDTLFDGAKSLVTGLGSMLRVASHGARVYDYESQGKFQIKASFMAAKARPSRKGRRGKLSTRTSYLPYFLARRTGRNADYGTADAQLQVNNQTHAAASINRK